MDNKLWAAAGAGTLLLVVGAAAVSALATDLERRARARDDVGADLVEALIGATELAADHVRSWRAHAGS